MSTFKKQQQEFVSLIRYPDILQSKSYSANDKQRIEIYQRLIFNNINGFLRGAFPVSCSLLPAHIWGKLVKQFVAEYTCTSPLFSEISEHFLDYIELICDSDETLDFELPEYLYALMHYEWIELELDKREADSPAEAWEGATLPKSIKFSAVAELLHYTYPVHAIGGEVDSGNDVPLGDYFYVVYRDNHYHVRFNLLNAAGAAILSCLIHDAQNEIVAISIVKRHASALFSSMDKDELNQQVEKLISGGLKQGFLLPG